MGLKMDGDEEAITTIIANAIAAPEGHLRLAKAEEFIIGEVERNRFNTERAVEIYTVAVDNSVWAWTKGTTLGKLMYRDYQRSGLGKKFAIELTEN
jgi:N-acetylglutamate synthase-like GNAT family acetyltransferase